MGGFAGSGSETARNSPLWTELHLEVAGCPEVGSGYGRSGLVYFDLEVKTPAKLRFTVKS